MSSTPSVPAFTDPQQLESALQAILQNTADIIFFKDIQGRYVSASEAAADFLGMAVVELIGKTDSDLFLPDILESVQQVDSQVMETGTAITFEERMVHKGESKTLMTTKSPWRDSQGQLLGVVGICRDLTELKQVEYEERQSRLRLRKVLDGLYSFVGLLTPQGILLEANQLALEAANLKSEDVLGRSLLETYWWSYSSECQAQLREAIDRAAAGETVRYDVPVRVKEDQFVTIDFSLVPLLDDAGKVEYLVPSGLDITSRQQTERALRENQAMIQSQLLEIETIYQTAPIGLAVLDTDLRFVRINQNLAEINGLSVENHINRSIRELLPTLADKAEPLLQQILQSQEPILNIEVNGETPAQPGVQRTWVESWYPLLGYDGKPVGINVVCQEVTERRKQDQALRESEARFRLITELLPQIFWTATPKGEPDYYSAHWYDFIGVSTESAEQWAYLDYIHPRRNAHVSLHYSSSGFTLSEHLQQVVIIPSGFEPLGVSAALGRVFLG